jgi:hypothetical protein
MKPVFPIKIHCDVKVVYVSVEEKGIFEVEYAMNRYDVGLVPVMPYLYLYVPNPVLRRVNRAVEPFLF